MSCNCKTKIPSRVQLRPKIQETSRRVPPPPPPPNSRYSNDVVKVIKPNREPNKTYRKYSLDTLDVCDEIYNKTIEWIESRKDFIFIEYNNMSDNK